LLLHKHHIAEALDVLLGMYAQGRRTTTSTIQPESGCCFIHRFDWFDDNRAALLFDRTVSCLQSNMQVQGSTVSHVRKALLDRFP